MNQTFCAVKKVVSLIHRDLWVWLVDHDFHRKHIGGQSTKILLDLYKEKSSRSSEKKSNLKHTNTESQLLNQLSDLSQFIHREWTLLNEGEAGTLEERTHDTAKNLHH